MPAIPVRLPVLVLALARLAVRTEAVVVKQAFVRAKLVRATAVRKVQKAAAQIAALLKPTYPPQRLNAAVVAALQKSWFFPGNRPAS